MRVISRFLLALTLLGQFTVLAQGQQALSGVTGAGTTAGATSNAPVLPAAPVINPINSSPTTNTLSPTGARRGVSISTVTVCDFADSSGAFTDIDDVCSLGGR